MSEEAFWGRGVADWVEFQEPHHLPLYTALLDALELPPNGSVLDAGCGSGPVSVLAAKRSIAVTGVDASLPFIEAAKARCPSGRFQVGDLREALPFANESFDGVVYCNALQFVPNAAEALREASRVLRPGGRVAVGLFDVPEKCDGAKPMGAILSLLPGVPSAAVGPFALSDPRTIARLIYEAGFIPTGAGAVEAPWHYPNREIALRALMSAGPSHQALALVGQEALTATLDAAIAPFRGPDGSYRMNNNFIFAAGRKA